MEKFEIAFRNLEEVVKRNTLDEDGGVLESYMELAYNMILMKFPRMHDEGNATLESIRDNLPMLKYSEELESAITKVLYSWEEWCAAVPCTKYTL